MHIVGEGRGADDLALYTNTGGAIATSGTVTIYGTSWASVCAAPCGLRLSSTSGSYFVNRVNDGPALHSRNFTFGAHKGDVTLRVRTGSKAAYISGLLLLTGGVTMTILGPMFLAFAKKYDHPERIPVGAALLGVGVAATVVGIVLLVRGRNRVRIEPGAPTRRHR